MKITRSSDWRDDMPFDVAVPAAEVLPGEPTRCAGCGADAEPRSRDELWVVKHKHPNNHAGYVRLYCSEHVPKAKPRAAEPVKPVRERRLPVRRADATPERVRALCPNCFVEVAATGTCGMCGYQAA
jgi:hypothetical protein